MGCSAEAIGIQRIICRTLCTFIEFALCQGTTCSHTDGAEISSTSPVEPSSSAQVSASPHQPVQFPPLTPTASWNGPKRFPTRPKRQRAARPQRPPRRVLLKKVRKPPSDTKNGSGSLRVSDRRLPLEILQLGYLLTALNCLSTQPEPCWWQGGVAPRKRRLVTDSLCVVAWSNFCNPNANILKSCQMTTSEQTTSASSHCI